jgi:hypothetical protein
MKMMMIKMSMMRMNSLKKTMMMKMLTMMKMMMMMKMKRVYCILAALVEELVAHCKCTVQNQR